MYLEQSAGHNLEESVEEIKEYLMRSYIIYNSKLQPTRCNVS
jgi:hypothetical protein